MELARKYGCCSSGIAVPHPRFFVAISDGCVQDPELFNDTIMNNIKYANFDATDERKSWLKST